MKNIMLSLLLLCSNSVFALESENISAKIPEQAQTVEAFAPAGWKIEQQIAGDLNNDNIADTVLELIQTAPDSADAELQRKLVIVTKKADQTFHKAAVAEHLLLCPTCSGAIGSAGAEITIAKGVLIVDHLVGSRETQNTVQRFRYDAKTKRFLLIGEDVITADRLTTASTSKSTNFLTGEQTIEASNNGKKVSKKKSKLAIKPKFIEDVAN